MRLFGLHIYASQVCTETALTCRKSGCRMEPCRVQGSDGSGSSGTMRPHLCRIWAPRRSGEIAALAARGMPVSLAVAMLAGKSRLPSGVQVIKGSARGRPQPADQADDDTEEAPAAEPGKRSPGRLRVAE
jgi:hypothetical protein